MPSRAGVGDAAPFSRNAEALTRSVLVLAHDHYRPRAHVFLFAHNTRHTFMAIVGKSLGRMLQQAGLPGCLRWRHRWRQIDEPFGIDGKATHDLQRGDGIFFANGEVLLQTGRNDTLAGDIFHNQDIILLLLRSKGGGLIFFGKERSGRLPVGIGSRNRDQLLFWVAQGRQLAAKGAASVDIDGTIQPVRLWHRCMTVDDHGLAAVFGGPVITNRQAKLVGLARRFSIEGKLTYPTRSPTLHRLFESGVGDHEPPIIQYVMAYKAIKECRYLLPKFCRLLLKLL